MLVFLYSFFKTYILFIKLIYIFSYLKFVSYINKIKIYYLVLLYYNIIKLNNIFLFFIKFKNSMIKIYDLFKVIQFNFLNNFKKCMVNLKVYRFFEEFYLFKLHKSTRKHFFYSVYRRLYSYFLKKKNKIRHNLISIIYNSLLNKKNKTSHYKFFFSYLIYKHKLIKRKKLKKKKIIKNLFSLFFFNLLIYFFIIFFFIFWLNNLLSKIFYLSKFFLIKVLKYNKNLFYSKVKLNYTVSRGFYKKKKTYKNEYYLKSLKANKLYLLYNKLNYLKILNIK